MTSFNIYNYATQSQIDNFKPTFLYLKQHSVTGKLYFGKTVSKDPSKYKGQGTYWNNHLNIHGKEYIDTVWFCLFTDIHELIKTAVNLQESMSIVHSGEFANFRIETGLDGGGNIGKKFSRHKENWSSERIKQHKEAAAAGGKTCAKLKLGCHDISKIDTKQRSAAAAKTALERGNHNLKNNHELYKEKRMKTYDQNGGSRGARNPAFGTVLMHHELIGNKRVQKEMLVEYLEQGWLIGAEYSENHKNARLGKKRGSYGDSAKISCVICRKVLGITNFNQHMKKYHS